MILVDTAVWIDHLRSGNARLRELLVEDAVVIHPFVIGELACGELRQRRDVIGLLSGLSTCDVAEHDTVLAVVEDRRLFRRGIGWVDAHLVTAALKAGHRLWTNDKQLRSVAAGLGLEADER